MITNTFKSQQPRRRKIFFVPVNTVAALLLPGDSQPDRVQVARAENLASTAKVIAVYNDWQRDAFGFIVEDPNFPEVAPGQALEVVPVMWEVLWLAVKPTTPPEDPAQTKLPLV